MDTRRVTSYGWLAVLAVTLAACSTPARPSPSAGPISPIRAQATATRLAAPTAANLVTVSAKSEGAAEQHMQSALAHLTAQERDLAARQVRMAMVPLQAAEKAATGDVKQALTIGLEQLDKLGRDLDEGTAKAEQDLRGPFAVAHFALAKAEYQLAANAAVQRDSRAVGQHLAAAATHVNQARVWFGLQAETANNAAVTGALNLAGNLTAGADVVDADVTSAMDALNAEINTLQTELGDRLLEMPPPKE